MRKGRQKYFVYADEAMLNKKKLDWRAAMEELYNIYRNNSKFGIWITGLIVVIVTFLFYTFS
jgi:hypothetical protein